MISATHPARARFPRLAFVGIVTLTLLAFGVLTNSSLRSLSTIEGLEQEEIAIVRVCGRLVHLDEVLTMSARMGAATGDEVWEDRYFEHVPKLDAALAEARRLAPIEQDAVDAQQTEEANEELLAMEIEAFDLIRAGRRQEAVAVLSSERYEELKQVYSLGNERYLASMRARVSGILEAERARARVERVVLVVLLPLIVLLWARVGRSIAAHVRQRDAVEQQLREQARALVAKNEEAREAARVKSEFLSRMSHEIRTPMNGVLGLAGLLAKTRLTSEQAEYVHTIVRSGNLLQSILNDILDFSKIEAGMLPIVPGPCCPRDLVRDVTVMLDEKARAKGIELESSVADDVPAAVTIDPVRVRQVLLNLVGNAVKFTEVGGVELRLERGTEPETLVCTVRDTGVGIPPDRLETVFEGFVQADDHVAGRFGGTGLGLTICRELTRLMGGSIAIESEVGRGTLLTVQLPAPEAPVSVDEPPAALPSTGAWRACVLVAEDNTVNRLVVRRMLERYGLTVDMVTNGEECVEAARRRDYGMIFMDLSMPVMNGLEAARAIRSAEGPGARTPIVALTASAFPGDIEACQDADMDGFVSKPIRESELLDAIEKWIGPPRAAVRGRPSVRDLGLRAS